MTQFKRAELAAQNAAYEAELFRVAQHLATSDKGRDALERVLAWLENSGLSLDHVNQESVLLLLEGAWGGKAGTVRDAMHQALGHYE